ncbi:MAG: endonuclease domain-containing protein [Caulobacteraceae bacterium]
MRSFTKTDDRAKALGGAMSPPEVILWAKLRVRVRGQPNFRRQHTIGPSIANFHCAAARLVIEIDGAGHGHEAQRDHDERRDLYMRRLGYTVVRCSAAEVMADADEVARGIYDMAVALIRHV